MVYGVSVPGSFAILYCVSLGFVLLALVASSYIPVPSFLRKFLVASANGKTVASGDEGADFFLSARGSANARTIAMSYFAGGMGAWVLYATAEMGANPQLSWLGMIGYSGASAFPAIVISLIAPKVKEISGNKSFTATDFAFTRYGRVMQLVVSIISVFYMFIYLVAELTSISNVFALLVNKSTFGSSNMRYTTHVAIVIVVITVFYTSIGGLPSSIVTDKIQAIVVLSMAVILLFAVTLNSENQVSSAEYAIASNATVDGFTALVTLVIALLCAELFNQANWQRVWAAESDSALKKGYLMATLPIFFIMMFFGIMGQIAYAKDPESYNTFNKLAYLSFFDLLAPLAPFWHVLVLILTCAFATSSIDSLQCGMAGIFNRDIVRMGSKVDSSKASVISKWFSRILLLAINIPAVILSTKRFDVIPLFLVADLVCATAVLPLFFGLMQKNWGFLKAPTELGAVLGSTCGVGSVLVNGKILGFTEATNYMGEVIAKGPFSYFWLTNGSICALCGTKTLTTFIVTPLVAGFFALFFSALDVAIRGEEAARKPLFGAINTEAEEEKENALKDVEVPEK